MVKQQYWFLSESVSTVVCELLISFDFKARRQYAMASSHGNPALCKAKTWAVWVPSQIRPGLAFFTSIPGMIIKQRPGHLSETDFIGLLHFYSWSYSINQMPETCSQPIIASDWTFFPSGFGLTAPRMLDTTCVWSQIRSSIEYCASAM